MLGVAVSLLVGGFLWQQYRPQGLQAYFLDVGQGDCVVLTTPEQKVIVYDTGGLQNLDTGKRIVAPFLRWLGKGKVDALVLSHFDFDHVGGAVGLLQQLQVREIVLPKEAFDEASLALYDGITKAALACGTQIKQAQQGEQWLLGDGTVLNIFVPADLINGSVNAREHVEEVSGNAASTVAAIHSPQGKLLLTGDLGNEEEALLNLGHYDVFKAGHHGSRNSNSEELLQKLQPQFVVISCGKNNSYGHPHRETLERIAEVGSRVLRTDELGCIRVSFDETGIKCYSYMYDRFMAVE